MRRELRPGTPAEAAMSEERLRRVVDLARGWVDEGIHPALVVLVARKGVVVIHEAFGRLGPEEDSPPLQRDTIFPIASIAKPFTATAAMILVEDGLLGLNRPVWWYLPEFAGEGKDMVMVHHLLTHTSGLDEWDDVEPYAAEQHGRVDIPPLTDETQHPLIHQYLHLRWGAPQWKPPGTEWSYCNYGYNLVAEIVRRISGQSLADFARERIFEPLGMSDSFYIVPEAVRPRIVRRADDAVETVAPFTLQPLETPWGCGCVYSTARDLAVFCHMFLNRGSYRGARVLSPWSVAEMRRNQIPGVGSRWGDLVIREACWGLGWNVRGPKSMPAYAETLQSARAYSHGGGGGTFIWVDPAYDMVGVYLSVGTYPSLPAGVSDAEDWSYGLGTLGQADLLINAVTAAVLE